MDKLPMSLHGRLTLLSLSGLDPKKILLVTTSLFTLHGTPNMPISRFFYLTQQVPKHHFNRAHAKKNNNNNRAYCNYLYIGTDTAMTTNHRSLNTTLVT